MQAHAAQSIAPYLNLTLYGRLEWSSAFTSPRNVNVNKNVLLYNTSGCLLRIPENKKLVVKDLHDFMIIDEGDILLIHPLNKEQEIKSIAEDVKNL